MLQIKLRLRSGIETGDQLLQPGFLCDQDKPYFIPAAHALLPFFII